MYDFFLKFQLMYFATAFLLDRMLYRWLELKNVRVPLWFF